MLDNLELVPVLEPYVEDLDTLQQISATLERDCPESVKLTERVQTAVYRIVQEAATNAIRHRKAKSLRIKLG